MTTTSHLQVKPDYYTDRSKYLESGHEKIQTNIRYKGFNQTHFTAGDIEQFQEFRNETNGRLCIPTIDLTNNIFQDFKYDFWNKYGNATAITPLNTFKYMFYKFKKGVFVKILNGKLNVFLPFSNASFENEWSSHIKVDPHYGNITDFIRHISEMEGRRFNPSNVNGITSSWYGNNCLVRYEYPINEGESNISCVKNMLEELCESREIPDMEFFINKRDFPILTKDETEAYNNLWDSESQPLVSHNYASYLPILSMSISDRFADILMITWDDWTRVQYNDGKYFANKQAQYDASENTIPWNTKKPTAVFRGGTTGCGTTLDTNMRLKASHISAQGLKDDKGIPYLDAGINKWNLRPRKIEKNPYLQTIEISSLTFGLSKTLTPLEQASYKYILNIDGHVTAFRLSLELSLGSVVLLAKSHWKIWYSHLLIPYEHYVPVEADLSDLIKQIQWCRDNDDKCEKIAQNALEFYKKYLNKESMLDYMQKLLIDAKNVSGMYAYNTMSPLDYQLEIEKKFLDELKAPKTTKTITNINRIPYNHRTYSLLKGLEYTVTLANNEKAFENVAQYKGDLFKNKGGLIRKFELAGFPLVVKTTSNKEKKNEHMHETYIGLKCINSLSIECPNFAYIFGAYEKNKTQNVVVEYIDGITLDEYLTSKNFDFKTFLSILLQISAALYLAQQKCAFVHYDLAPWNIMIKKLEKEEKFEYVLDMKHILLFKTDIIPVIIDFGKSHVVYEDMHYGFTQMYKTSRIHDIITVLSNCLYTLLTIKETTIDESDILNLANFISKDKNDYRKKEFTSISDLKKFLNKSRKYFTMLSSNKHQLENLSPYNFIKYINDTFSKKYKLNFGSLKKGEKRKEYTGIYTGRQIFDFILAKTTEEHLYTFALAIQRLKGSTMLLGKNKFEIYYAAQNIYSFLIELRTNMENYMLTEQSRITPRDKMFYVKYREICDKTTKSVHKMYSDLLKKVNASPVLYNEELFTSNTTLIQAPYTCSTFLLPNEIEKLLDARHHYINNPSQFFSMVVTVLTYTGMFSLTDDDVKFYTNNFNILLSSNPILLTNNVANENTLEKTVKKIYKENIDKLSDEKCDSVTNLLLFYEKIIQII
jgi:hypothetical protein